ncbi:similar to Saccharomyces cerevisiae YLR222C UTP13 Nucleolar protein, component of the small subunit (SSU) processome containing the U3 snoRNA that is involved in processing of pre-18S rRNA [Maudiozyma barnettii]|uniref:Similar to Saccharomyces cerevisiae YLR222C UTP13 Nucleolar protein, component of the small subunit (SSU) processome containing the U3 snoRNA that is involved in processing of pre-18S rRNA n=1 Tax=Maudiozyma barnettii TaxID=61262 RepID=A0A8H2ZHU5_9SACH|nr:Utp13p [Kazachstania barnettii]CAB4255173.1 similar to Saccharomyces cerevisiae YLR222C UTP13 Nucleolar protein, component of the small subunit (SSU) processome containing the U3 snoRNA that is involved in processing of pre-18S rRNA [Kazachstania barnettii]CAD1783444.1 similar to Saccharomyces cerevisiae YLR222C UTP13 Nucleolar protein, component of the small subunit (SSU) processome containing the U3 snoRNA that is involved in processing of pre-18S rRNA [Kazachstania barnettii]
MSKVELITSYSNSMLAPIYAGSGAVASVSEDGTLMATPVLDEINIIQLKPEPTLLHKITNDDEQDITALHITPDGKFLCFVSQAQLLKIFSIKEGKIIRSMKTSSPCYIIDTDSTSTLVSVGGTDGSIIVVDIENGYITHSFKGHGGTISSLKFYGEPNTNNWLLTSGDTNGVLKIWDLVKRKCLHTTQEHTSAIRGLDVRELNKESEDNNNTLQLISGGRDNILNFWEFDTKKRCKLIKTIPVSQQIESCGFVSSNIDNDLVYTAGGDAIFQCLSLSDGSVVKSTKKPMEELFIVGVLPILNQTKVYTVLSDQTIELLNVEESLQDRSEPIITAESCIAGNHGTIADMVFVGPNHNKIALATNSPTLRIIPSLDMESKSSEEKLLINVDFYEGHSDLLNAVTSTEDGLWIATASKDHTAIVWKFDESINKFVLFAKFVGHSASVTAISFPNVILHGYPEYLLTGSNDLTIKKWKIPKPSTNTSEKESLTHTINTSEYTRHAHEKDINALSIAPNDSVFATASYDKTCKVWDLETGNLVATLANHKRGLWDVSFCHYDKILATCSGDKTIKIWSLETFTVQKTLEGHTNAVQRCTFINKQNQLVSSGADGLVKIWDCSTGECVKTLDGHANRIWALNAINDGELIVSADADGVIQFWKDCTEAQREEDLEKEKVKVEQEQTLQNYLNEGDWTNAFLLALMLDHPMRLFNVLRQSGLRSEGDKAEKDSIFNKELDELISKLNHDQILLLFKRCRDWNTNARTHSVAQKTIKCILQKQNISELSEIPGIIKIIDGIIPYTERHFARVDNLVEQSYILDYALVEMDKLF